jgi:uncharacterized protein YggL (DUF469 family)
LHITEVLGHGQRGERDAKARARGLVHLTEHQRSFFNDAGLGHFQEEVVSFTGALPHAGEHRHTTEVLSDAIDHLLDQHRLAHAGASE